MRHFVISFCDMFKQLLDVQVGDVYASFLVVVAVLATKCRPNIVQLMLCLTQCSNILNTYIVKSTKVIYIKLFIKNVVM